VNAGPREERRIFADIDPEDFVLGGRTDIYVGPFDPLTVFRRISGENINKQLVRLVRFLDTD
jgi:hypothetical protein